MNRKNFYDQVMSAIRKSNKTFDILNEQNGKLCHIRFQDGADLWPSTATIKIGTKYHRRDYETVARYLGGHIEVEKPKSNAERIGELEEYVLWLEREIDVIRRHLSI